LDEQTGAATMFDHDDDWDRSEIVDLDVTGDPQLYQFAYRSPRQDFTPEPAPEFDYLGQFKRDLAKIEADNARRERRRAAVRDSRSTFAGPRPLDILRGSTRMKDELSALVRVDRAVVGHLDRRAVVNARCEIAALPLPTSMRPPPSASRSAR
jgi:hypothetical protein